MILQHAVLPAEMPRAEPAVADDTLGGLLALLEAAADLLRRHAAADGEEEVERGVGEDVRGVEGGVWL